ncbi:MAG: hypothetical protein WCS30_13135 [Selenomonadaceae bacterium]
MNIRIHWCYGSDVKSQKRKKVSPVNVSLINEPPLLVLPTLAVEVGLNEAIFLQQIHYWVSRSTHIIDGRSWVYNSLEEWRKQFPFWSARTIDRIVSNLCDKKILITGVFNQKAFDRTKWYTIDYDKLTLLEQKFNTQKERLDSNKTSCQDPSDKNGSSNVPTCHDGEESPQLCIMPTCHNASDKSGSSNTPSCHNGFDKNGSSIMPDCHDALSQSGTIHHDNLAGPIPETTTEITTEITKNYIYPKKLPDPLENKDLAEAQELFSNELHPITSVEYEILQDLLMHFGKECVKDGILKSKGKTIQYLTAVLRNQENQGGSMNGQGTGKNRIPPRVKSATEEAAENKWATASGWND